jgi:SAM-dependent methyltransferase
VSWDGDAYQARFDALAERGVDVHGEAAFVCSLEPAPASVLDAGCGTGRVACELTRRGVAVVGVDVDSSMLAVARRSGANIEWVEHDLVTLALGRTFDVVLMAGNVPLFTAPGTQAALVAGAATHVGVDGGLVAGFQLGRGFELGDYDASCAAAGLTLVERYASWDREPFVAGGDYAVSVHRRS